MSDKSTKQPAHKVIIRKLEERVVELRSYYDGYSGFISIRLRILEVIGTLCDVLREMVIPEKEREKVLAELQRIAAMWRPDIAGLNLIEDLRVILSR